MTITRWIVLALAALFLGISINLFSQKDFENLHIAVILLVVAALMGFAFSKKQVWSSVILFYADTTGLYFPPPRNPWEPQDSDESARTHWLHIPWYDIADIYSTIERDRDGVLVESIVFAFSAYEDAVKQFWVEQYHAHKLQTSLGLTHQFFHRGLWHAKYADGVFEHGVPTLVNQLKILARPQSQ